MAETKRLMIRRFRPKDGADLYDYLSREEVVRFEPYEMFSREEADREAARRAGDETFWAVCLRESGKLIGNIYLAKQEFDTWELGYVFNSDFWGKGYAYEAAKAFMNSVFINQGGTGLSQCAIRKTSVHGNCSSGWECAARGICGRASGLKKIRTEIRSGRTPMNTGFWPGNGRDRRISH